MDVETINIDTPKLEAFRGGLKGTAFVSGDEGYEGARAAWNLNAHQHPAVVVVAEGAADVLAAVRLAREEGLGVGVMATGHGVAAPADGGVLINTSRMKGVRVDPETRTARVEAGAKWGTWCPRPRRSGLRACRVPPPTWASSATRWAAASVGLGASTGSPPTRSRRPTS